MEHPRVTVRWLDPTSCSIWTPIEDAILMKPKEMESDGRLYYSDDEVVILALNRCDDSIVDFIILPQKCVLEIKEWT